MQCFHILCSIVVTRGRGKTPQRGLLDFYTHPHGYKGASQSFDLLFEGIEITTGGQRLHKRGDLEQALTNRNLNPASFENHLQMFELGMPPHGGLAIGLERLTSRILQLPNVRQASLYPRDRYRIAPSRKRRGDYGTRGRGDISDGD